MASQQVLVQIILTTLHSTRRPAHYFVYILIKREKMVVPWLFDQHFHVVVVSVIDQTLTLFESLST